MFLEIEADIGPAYVNKDYQRKMVDPMLMTIQSILLDLFRITFTRIEYQQKMKAIKKPHRKKVSQENR